MSRLHALFLLAGLAVTGCTPPATVSDAQNDSSSTAPNATASKPATIESTGEPSPGDSPAPEPPQPAELGKLTIGDSAPAIAVTQWVKGEPVDGLVKGKVNVVEFWATWCGPCLRNMPHLSQLQDEYGDEINVMGFTREDSETVTQFMAMEQSAGKTWDEVLTYRVAIDDDSKTSEAYMRAAGQRGIPCAFIIGKDGFVEWIGHPAGMDEPLASVVGDSWDRAAALAEREKQKKSEEAMTAFGQKLNELMAAEDHDGAIAIVDEFAGEHPEMSLQLLMTKAMILGQAERSEEQTVVYQKVVQEAPENAGLLNQIAWQVATETKNGDLDFALETALQASELSDHKDGSTLDTVARVHYELGDLASAVEWQSKAVEAAAGNESVVKTLEKYQAELKSKSEETDSDGEEEGEHAHKDGDHDEDAHHEKDGDDHDHDEEHGDEEHGDDAHGGEEHADNDESKNE